MNWLRTLSLSSGIALAGCVIAGVLAGTDAARLAGAFIALIFFKLGSMWRAGGAEK